MSWIAISDGRRVLLSPGCLPDVAAPLVATGSLVIEVGFSAENGTRQTVINLAREQLWPRRLRVTLGEAGDMLVEHRQGNTITNTILKFPQPDREATLRITVSWHSPGRLGLLTVENLDSGDLNQAVIEEPNPWPMDDIAALIRQDDGCTIDGSVALLAVSDRVEPVGLNAGFAAGTLIDTSTGPRPVEELRPGDVVMTADLGHQPIRGVVSHEVPAVGRFAPIELCAPFVGLRRDLTVAPDHRLLISGTDAEYLFGSDSVLVEARHLARLAARPRGEKTRTIRYVQVLLDAHMCLSVAGAYGESLFLGDLADRSLRHATSLVAETPADALPRHTRVASRELRSYEAMVLVSAMCA
ncbi:MAG: hypothetical protein GY717_14210 [Rhodobacteraceae bacterium]|nr:hypothetical protein [Paracoccaceae bacterium]